MPVLISAEALPYCEDAIYLPMIIVILERDIETIKKGPFKFKGPYVSFIEGTLQKVRAVLKETNAYLKRNNMQVIKKENDGIFTEYAFLHGGYEDSRRYLNFRLRNRTEELINMYFKVRK